MVGAATRKSPSRPAKGARHAGRPKTNNLICRIIISYTIFKFISVLKNFSWFYFIYMKNFKTNIQDIIILTQIGSTRNWSRGVEQWVIKNEYWLNYHTGKSFKGKGWNRVLTLSLTGSTNSLPFAKPKTHFYSVFCCFVALLSRMIVNKMIFF